MPFGFFRSAASLLVVRPAAFITLASDLFLSATLALVRPSAPRYVLADLLPDVTRDRPIVSRVEATSAELPRSVRYASALPIDWIEMPIAAPVGVQFLMDCTKSWNRMSPWPTMALSRAEVLPTFPAVMP